MCWVNPVRDGWGADGQKLLAPGYRVVLLALAWGLLSCGSDKHGMRRLGRYFVSSSTHFSHLLGQSPYPVEYHRLGPRLQK